ncbi:hypothetical protein [Neisseria meningitidis]
MAADYASYRKWKESNSFFWACP